MKFEMWRRRWGIDLDDVSFANAWIALGLVEHLNSTVPNEIRSINQLELITFDDPVLHWSFPSGRDVVGTPEEWAHAWKHVSEKFSKPVRLRVHYAPADELGLPWYRTLSGADPAPGAVSMYLTSPRAQLHIDWPLRIGFLSENSENVVDQVMTKSPSNDVAKGVRLGRVTSNCDVLIQKSSPQVLLQELLQQPFKVKTNIIVLQGGDEAVWGEIDALLTPVLTLTRASGFILVPPKMEDKILATMINRMVREFTHDVPLDVALSESILWTKSPGVVAGFTPEITTFTIRDLVMRFNTRIEALPKGTTIDMSRIGPADEWLTSGLKGGGMRGGESKEFTPPGEDQRVTAETIRIDKQELGFESEREGGTVLAQVSRAMATASLPSEKIEVRAARFLQQKSFVRLNSEFQDATDGFIAGVPAMIRVRIAAPEEGWDSLPTEFPVEKLPQHLDHWKLTVWLTEPEHLPVPLKGEIKLPRDGDSTEWDFHFKPGTASRFSGRLTVLYRGRIIQTAVLRAGVRATADSFVDDAKPKLEDFVAVRHRIGDLDQRRQFDIAFVANHDDKGRPLLTSVSEKAAWVNDLSKIVAVAAQINQSLIPVAMAVDDYADGLNGESGRKLLIDLAKHGGWLRLRLNEQFKDPSNNLDTTKKEFVQIVSTKSDSVVPLEFVYDYAVPVKTAKVCPHWLDAAKNDQQLDKCPDTCDRDSGGIVCPMGFWGLQKVIERHAVTPGHAKDGKVLYLQSEPDRESDTLYVGGVAVVGSSNRVPEKTVKELKDLISELCGTDSMLATNWDQWEQHVKDHRPNLLIALPHTDGVESNITLEIGGEEMETITLRNTHVFPLPSDGRQAPLVALIGCDVTGTAAQYGDHVVCFRDRGAGIVIGTIATVFGPHAAKVAGKLVEGLLKPDNGKPVRLGELIRTIRRNSLREGLLMPLCLVAYGDADWILSPKKTNDV